MHDKISDISAILGISPQSVRLYEKHGIVQTEKDMQTGYRYFSRPELNTLLNARHLRAYDFGLTDIATLLNDATLDEICPACDMRIDALEQELNYRNAILQHLKEERAHIANAIQMIGQCQLVTSPSFYFLPYMFNDKLLRSPSLRSALNEWSASAPFASRISFVSGEDLSNILTGYFLEQPHASLLSQKALDAARLYAPMRCVYTSFFVEKNSHSTPTRILFKQALEYLDLNGLTLAGDILFRPLVLLKRKSLCQLLGEVYLPY